MNSRNEDVIKAAIRGVFDTDACFFANKQNYANNRTVYPGRISVLLASKPLFEQLLVLFSKIGFSCRGCYHPPSNSSNRNNSASYKVMINKQVDVERFFFEIGTNNLRHAIRYLTFRKLGFIPVKSTIDERLAFLNNNFSFIPPQLL